MDVVEVVQLSSDEDESRLCVGLLNDYCIESGNDFILSVSGDSYLLESISTLPHPPFKTIFFGKDAKEPEQRKPLYGLLCFFKRDRNLKIVRITPESIEVESEPFAHNMQFTLVEQVLNQLDRKHAVISPMTLLRLEELKVMFLSSFFPKDVYSVVIKNLDLAINLTSSINNYYQVQGRLDLKKMVSANFQIGVNELQASINNLYLVIKKNSNQVICEKNIFNQYLSFLNDGKQMCDAFLSKRNYEIYVWLAADCLSRSKVCAIRGNSNQAFLFTFRAVELYTVGMLLISGVAALRAGGIYIEGHRLSGAGGALACLNSKFSIPDYLDVKNVTDSRNESIYGHGLLGISKMAYEEAFVVVYCYIESLERVRGKSFKDLFCKAGVPADVMVGSGVVKKFIFELYPELLY